MISINLYLNQIEVIVDPSIYSESICLKVLYWLVDEFFVSIQTMHTKLKIVLEKKNGKIDNTEYQNIKNKLNQDFIDFKNREIIVNETKDIRSILYIKAFSNNDDFEDFNLLNH